MNKILLRNKFWVIMLLCLALALTCSDAFARGGHDGGRYHWRGGRWYRPGWFGWEVAVSALTIGAIVENLPLGHRTVVVAGIPYYYYDNVYYRPYAGGYYVVVPAPAVAQNVIYTAPVVTQAQEATSGQTVTLNVPNSKGGYTAVTLTKRGNGYAGPQGEYYEGNPTIDQLKVLYGK